MAKWWHVSWKRVLIGLAVVLAGLYLIDGAIVLAARWFEPWFEGRALSHNDRYRLSLTPASLPDQNLAKLNGVTIRAFGITMQTPWAEAPVIQTNRNTSRISFASESVTILIFNPISALDPTTRMMSDPKNRKYFGEGDLSSKYEFFSREMLATPADLHWWKGRSATGRGALFLGLKSLDVGEAATLYSVRAGQIKGFQIGDPATFPYQVRLDLFDPTDRHYQVHISSIEKPALSQAQLNAMIASFRPVSDN